MGRRVTGNLTHPRWVLALTVPDDEPPRTILITGANSGIGETTAHALADQGHHVIMLCRDEAKGEQAQASIHGATGNPSVELVTCDLASQEQIRTTAEVLNERLDRLDTLVNNAGLVLNERTLTEDGIETQFATNHLAPFLLTHETLPLLEESTDARVVTVASEAHRNAARLPDGFQNTQGRYSGFLVYSQTKLYNILFTMRLARHLEPLGITANCLHPGVVASNFGRQGPWYVRWFMKIAGVFLRDPKEGAATSIHLAADPDVKGTTGEYFIDKTPKTPAPRAHDLTLQDRLWATSEDLTRATDWPTPRKAGREA